MKRILLNVVLMILAFTVQNCVFPLIPFLTATPNLLLILTFSFGFIYGKKAGLLYGLFAAPGAETNAVPEEKIRIFRKKF